MAIDCGVGMTILLAPFARKAPILNGSGSPKNYPFARELVELLLNEGHVVIQVGGNDEEQIASDFRKGLPFNQVEELIQSCDTAICADSYLQHHCWLVGKRAIVLWGVSDPLIFGHSTHINLLKGRDFLRPNQFDLYYSNQVNPEAFVSPQEVVDALKQL